eukprot:3578658-Amphidinium_carterae.1
MTVKTRIARTCAVWLEPPMRKICMASFSVLTTTPGPTSLPQQLPRQCLTSVQTVADMRDELTRNRWPHEACGIPALATCP